MPASASVTPETARISASTFSSNSRFCSTDVVNGSTLCGVVHSATAAGSGASRTSSFFTRAEARATSIARAATASTPARLKSLMQRTPSTFRDHAHPDPERLGLRGMSNSSVLGGQRAVADRDHARVGISNSAHGCGVQSQLGNGLHCRLNLSREQIYRADRNGSCGDGIFASLP